MFYNAYQLNRLVYKHVRWTDVAFGETIKVLVYFLILKDEIRCEGRVVQSISCKFLSLDTFCKC